MRPQGNRGCMGPEAAKEQGLKLPAPVAAEQSAELTLPPPISAKREESPV